MNQVRCNVPVSGSNIRNLIIDKKRREQKAAAQRGFQERQSARVICATRRRYAAAAERSRRGLGMLHFVLQFSIDIDIFLIETSIL